MKIKCSWCGKAMGEKEPLDDQSTTHGICKECLHRIIPEFRVEVWPGKWGYQVKQADIRQRNKTLSRQGFTMVPAGDLTSRDGTPYYTRLYEAAEKKPPEEREASRATRRHDE